MSDSLYAHYGSPVDAEYKASFHAVPPPGSVEEVRQLFANILIPEYRAQFESRLPEVSKYKVADHVVPVANGTANIDIRTIVPVAAEGTTFPTLVWLHGGAFMFGSYTLIENYLTILSVELQIAMVLVNYRLSPEHPHPIPFDDCYEGLKWTVSNAASVGIDLAKGFIVGGDSAGASLTATVTHLARDDAFFEGKQPTGQILDIPCFIDPRAYPEKYKADLRSIDMTEDVEYVSLSRQFIYNMYQNGLQNDPADIKASPLLFPSHANLPPAVFQIAGLDVLRDEGMLYEKLLREAGVKTKFHVYPGVSHGSHHTYYHLKASQKFHDDYKAGLQWLLAGAKE